MAQVKNDRDFDVTISYEVDGVSKEVLLAPGQEAEVPDSAADAVKAQVTDAEAPAPAEGEQAPEPPIEEGAQTPEGESAPPVEEPVAGMSDEKIAKLQKDLAEANGKLATRDAEATYNNLLSDGKIAPAQKDAYMKIATAGVTTVSLADGSSKSLNDLIAEFIQAGPKLVKFGEEGRVEDEAPKTPWDELTDDQRAASEAIKVTAEEYNKVHGEKVTT